MENKLFAPLGTLQWIPRSRLKPNDYNPNKVSKENLKVAHAVHSYQWMDTPDCCKTGLYDYRRIPSMDCFWRRAAAVYAWREGAYCYR